MLYVYKLSICIQNIPGAVLFKLPVVMLACSENNIPQLSGRHMSYAGKV